MLINIYEKFESLMEPYVQTQLFLCYCLPRIRNRISLLYITSLSCFKARPQPEGKKKALLVATLIVSDQISIL